MSDNTNDQEIKKENSNKKSDKKNKQKGPIRLEAIIPVVVVILAVFLYFKFLFDSNLKSALEFGGTQVHGAEVNISKIESSFFGAYFHLYGLAITNKEKPTHNLLEIGQIKFQLVWDALLRAKFVVEKASIENILVASKRAKVGYVVPPTPPGEEPSGANKALKEVESKVLEQAKGDFDQNVLGDIANILGGTNSDDQLNKITSELKSEKRINEIQKALDEKKLLWDKRIKELPNQKELNKINTQIKKLKFNTKNPKQFANDLKTLDKIIKDADRQIKLVNSTGKGLNKDINGLNASIKEIEALVNKDINDLQKRFKIPQIDTKGFSKKLFGKMFQERIAGYAKYIEMGKKYMPPKKTASEKQPDLIPSKRQNGRNYNFSRKKGYPLFWLKHAKISSKAEKSEFGGDLTGELTNLTSSPTTLGIPTIFTLKGDFPNQNIFGIDANLTLDHTKDEAVDTLSTSIKSFPLGYKKLSSSDSVEFAIREAHGRSEIKGVMKDSKIQITAKNYFTKLKYDIASNNKDIKEVLTNVVNGMPLVTIVSEATGSWSDIKWNINSNLGSELSKGFKKQLQAKIDEARKKIKDYVDNKINAEREKLTGEFSKVKSEIDNKISKSKKQVTSAKNKATKDLNKNKAKNKAKKNLEKKGKKALEDLKKKFKF
ncbi:MAG: TIGR03545 family protein [Bdellovibrionaceae bacterium]|nr:TIGR03545 family protein [Pseudobdellovibrionaceae bacterium]